MSTRFPLPQAALDICQEAVSTWSAIHCPENNLDEQARMLASRVNSWVSPTSVAAGVYDVMSCQLPQTPEMRAAIDALGDRLGRLLMDGGLLIASPRRAASLG